MRQLGMLVTAVLVSATAAFAQDTSKVEVSGGWRYYHATINNPSGAVLALDGGVGIRRTDWSARPGWIRSNVRRGGCGRFSLQPGRCVPLLIEAVRV